MIWNILYLHFFKDNQFVLMIATSLSLALSVTSYAQDIPVYDVNSYCEEVASVGGSSSQSVKRGCFQMEQSAYDEVKEVWHSVPDETRSYCDEVASIGGGSYSTLNGCIAMESRARQENENFEFTR